ncbi:hypothetical protein [Sodalis sp.]|uniref:hypothetical protein n=1 Tax=Sodalis sp. (in: enterobacteria) TaxID=1898979 RepID=UPI003873C13D
MDTQLGILFVETALSLLRQTRNGVAQGDGYHLSRLNRWHGPNSAAPFTLQIVNNSRVATMTGITYRGCFACTI